MFDQLRDAAEEMEAALAGLEPKSMIGTQPAVCLEILSGHERAVAAARLRVTARAAEMNHWQRQGYRSFENWYAATFGTTPGQARRRTRTARNLDNGRHSTADALADGDISEDEADVITDAADKNPAAEQELLDTAKNKSRNHDDLKKQATDAKAAGEDDRARADRLRRGRRAGWGVDCDGYWTLSGRFEPHVGAEMKAHLAAETDRIFAANRKAGTREGHDRYRADAVANLIRGHHTTPSPAGPADNAPAHAPAESEQAAAPNKTGEPAGDGGQLDLEHSGRPPSSGPSNHSDAPTEAPHAPTGHPQRSGPSDPSRAESGTRVNKELVIDINLETLRRGRVLSDETCQIRGVGPVPVEIARQWADDAFVKAVIRDGTDIKTVTHYGRHLPTEVRTALGIRDQHVCQVPGCTNPRIEYDHHRTHADHGPTSTTNLRALCVPHHRQRTHHHYELEGEPGDRTWTDPHGNVLFADDPAKLTADTARAP